MRDTTVHSLTALFLCLGCGGPETPTSPSTELDTPTERRHEVPSEPTGPTHSASPAEPEVFVGRIVGRGPLGHGACVQQSYEVERADGERLWVHFERCGEPSGPSFEALESNRSYRFTVRRGASANFGDDPMIVDAEPAP